MRSILAAAGAGGPGCPPRSRALDLPEGCGRVRCSSCRQSAGRTCRNSSCLRRWRARVTDSLGRSGEPFLDDADGLHHGRARARGGAARQAAWRLPMQPICISAEPVVGARICIAGADRTNEYPRTPRGRSTSPRASGQRRTVQVFGCSSVVLQLAPWRTTVRQVLPAPSSPGIPPEDRRVAGRWSRCPAVRFVLITR